MHMRLEQPSIERVTTATNQKKRINQVTKPHSRHKIKTPTPTTTTNFKNNVTTSQHYSRLLLRQLQENAHLAMNCKMQNAESSTLNARRVAHGSLFSRLRKKQFAFTSLIFVSFN